MSLELLHQCGHNGIWNTTAFAEGCGDGLILSPVHQKKSDVESLDYNVRQRSIFDPQYYLPNSQKAKLRTYPFFPETISSGFKTNDFSLVALESARQCVEFQVSQEFKAIVIPARFFDQMDPEYTEKQDVYTVHPFLKALSERGAKKPVFLTLPLTFAMVQSKPYRTTLLNWVTSFPEIQGVYIFAASTADTKQIENGEVLSSYLDFLTELKGAGLQLIIGYCNTEGLLFSLLGDTTVTFGTFENTRMFSIDKFVVTEEERRGPKPRIYLPALMNWIQFSQAKTLKNSAAELWDKIYTPSKYGDDALAALAEPTFNSPSLYKHHFVVFQQQFAELREKDPVSRYKLLRQWLKDALALTQEIQDVPFDLERHGAGLHLQPWLDTINVYYKAHLDQK